MRLTKPGTKFFARDEMQVRFRHFSACFSFSSITDGREIEPLLAAQVSHRGLARMDSDAGAHGQFCLAGVERDQLLVQLHGGETGPASIIFLFHRSVPNRQNRVPDQLDDGPVSGVNALQSSIVVIVQ